MSDLSLIPVLHLGHAPTTPEKRLEQYVQRVVAPLVTALQGAQGLRVGLHVTGWLLKWLARKQAPLLKALTQVIATGRVEVLGGGWTDPFLSGLPDADAQSQIQLQAKLVERWIRRRPQGFWLAQCAWDPSLTRLLARSGYTHTFVDEGALGAAGVPEARRWGAWRTEAAGRGLLIFPTLAEPAAPLSAADPVGAMIDALSARRERGAEALCWALPLDRVLSQAEVEGLVAILEMLNQGEHLMKTLAPSEAVDRLPSQGRIYPPPWIPLALQGASVDQPPDGTGIPAPAPGWESFLARYDECDRLHKRMVQVSGRLGRLRAALRAGKSTRRDALEAASQGLYRAQASALYVHGERPGFYDASVRHLAYAELICSEQSIRTALGESEKLERLRTDYDCDGGEEVLIHTTEVCAVVSPARGGALLELDLWRIPGNLLNTMTRRPEPYHEVLEGCSGLPALVVDGDEPGASIAAGVPPAPQPELEAMARRLHYDRAPRASFVDRFLDESRSLANALNGRLPEVGDFADGRYRLLAVEPHEILDACVVQMTREGHVLRGRQTCLVQVAKRFIFHRDLPVLDARYEVTNRYHTPLETTFAIELNLGLDTRFARSVRVRGDRGRAADPGAPGVLQGVRRLVIEDPRGRFSLAIDTSTPAEIYHYPVECMVRVGQGIKPAPQGLALLLSWPLKLWGNERAAFDLSLNFETAQ